MSIRRLFARLLPLLLCAALLTPALPAAAEGMAFTVVTDEYRPGKVFRVGFMAGAAGTADVRLLDASGGVAAVLRENLAVRGGTNYFSWDGTDAGGDPIAAGAYTLTVTSGGDSCEAAITVGAEAPRLLRVTPSDTSLLAGADWRLEIECNMAGTLSLDVSLPEGDAEAFSRQVAAGVSTVAWNGTLAGKALPEGEYDLTLRLSDDTGYASNAHMLTVSVRNASTTVVSDDGDGYAVGEEARDESGEIETDGDYAPETQSGVVYHNDGVYTPAWQSAYPCTHENCYWNLPMGVMDEQAIWNAMMQPVTTVRGEQTALVTIREAPDASSAAVGEVTCESQALHVLENLDNGWSLVECYSSSIHTSKVKQYATFCTGYIKTSMLETKQPYAKYGLLLDKLTQRLYVFEDGHIKSELLASTGLVNSKQPWNETPAGTFLVVSWSGGFWAGNMYCDKALRVCGGILLHEVPCFIKGDTRHYEYFEKDLGKRASHGCIRVQSKMSPEGVNMRWLWENLKKNAVLLIWEDVKGRQYPVPADATQLFYNENGGQNYHSDAYCKGVRDKYLPLSGFTYGELDTGKYAKLTRCPNCAPPLRKAEIEEINARYRVE